MVVVTVTVVLTYQNNQKQLITPVLTFANKSIFLFDNKRKIILQGQVVKVKHKPKLCNKANTELCLLWENMVKLEVNRIHHKNNVTKCHQFVTTAESREASEIEHCYNMNGSYWYSSFESKQQEYLMNNMDLPYKLYTTGNINSHQLGPILNRVWMASSGVAIIMGKSLPLWLSIKNEHLCFKTQHDDNLYKNILHLTYTICHAGSVKEIQKFLRNNYIGNPSRIPNEDMISKPVWTIDLFNRTQSYLEKFVSNIRQCNYTCSVLQLAFSQRHFVHVSDSTEHSNDHLNQIYSFLHKHCYKYSLTMSPFVNINYADKPWKSNCSQAAAFVTDHRDKKVSLLVNKHNFLTFIYNPWDKCLTKLVETNLQHLHDKFKYSVLTVYPGTSQQTLSPEKPLSDYTSSFIKILAASKINHTIIALSGNQMQRLPVFVQSAPRESTWGWAGLKSVIPTVLMYSMYGYTFSIPDSVGGSLSGGINIQNAAESDKELFIRWMQTVLFMPTIKLSILPCNLNGKYADIAEKMLLLREEKIPVIRKLAKISIETGVPIIRPLWWMAPYDDTALKTDSQFLLGDTILVAPMMEPDGNSRDIYLPKGVWHDELKHEELAGGRKYFNYMASLDELPHFTKTADDI